jgi:hypothetical protein
VPIWCLGIVMTTMWPLILFSHWKRWYSGAT